MKNSFLLTLLLTSTAFAGHLCDITGGIGLKKSTLLPHEPNYFFKASPDGRYIYYITKTGNRVLDTQTSTTQALPGTADPVPSPDGALLTFLYKNEKDTIGFRVGAVKMTPAWKSPKSTTQDWATTIIGSYQSIGPLVDGKRTFFYQNDHTSELSLMDLKVAPQDGDVKVSNHRTISGINTKLRLPMLSPDGKFFSALDTNANQTVIYALNGTAATLVDRLPVSAGKATFSYDSKKLTFHLAKKKNSTQEIWYPGLLADDKSVRNVYVYDRASKKITPVTNNQDEDSYFPVFLKDGTVAFVTKRGPQYSIDVSEVPKIESMAYEDIKACVGEYESERVLRQLGSEWAQLCTNWKGQIIDDGGVDLSTALTLPKSFCSETAKKYPNDHALGNFCRALEGMKPSVSAPLKPSAPVVPKGKTLFQNKCIICHQDGERSLADSPKLRGMLSGELKPQMPVGGSKLTPTEVDDLIGYLKLFKRL
jgi:hypothetical protein